MFAHKTIELGEVVWRKDDSRPNDGIRQRKCELVANRYSWKSQSCRGPIYGGGLVSNLSIRQLFVSKFRQSAVYGNKDIDRRSGAADHVGFLQNVGW